MSSAAGGLQEIVTNEDELNAAVTSLGGELETGKL